MGRVHSCATDLSHSPVISDFKPAYKLNAAWSSDDFASLGNTLKPKNLQDAPSVSLTAPTSDALSCTSGETYVITVTDPDAPSRDNPKWSEMCHWIATGIFVIDSAEPSSSGCSLSGLADLKDVVPYKPPGPPPKTGKHRYVFLVFTSGNGTTEPLNVTKPDDRQHWGTGKEGHGVRDWARDNGLVPVGE